MSKFIMVLVEVVIFSAIIGTLALSITGAIGDNNSNITGASAVLMGLISLFVVIGFIVMILKQSGVKSR